MQAVLNVDDVKRVEVGLTRAGVSVSELMHRAGLAAAQEVLDMGEVHKVVVLCGMGNNGGDGWVAARALKSADVDVCVVSPASPEVLSQDLCRQVAQAAVASDVEVLIGPSRLELEQLLSTADVVLDCILGTGFHGQVKAPFDIWISCINECAARVVAVDVPSGLSAQLGQVGGICVMADMTVTMIALKPGLLADDGRDYSGAIVVAPLAEQTERLVREAEPVAWRCDLSDYANVLPTPRVAVDKFKRGTVLVVGGSRRYVGAPLLAAKAAARSGAGYVTLAVPASIAPMIQMQVPEIVVIGLPEDADGTLSTQAASQVVELSKKRDVTLVGPGMRVTGGTAAVVSALLSADTPLVVDADGLNCIARLTDNKLHEYPELTRRVKPLVMTPHRGELARLVDQQKLGINSLAAQLDAARKIVWSDGGSEMTIVSKSSATACVNVKRALLPKPGPFALATAGSGDILGGVIASQLAQAASLEGCVTELCAYASEIHALAGQLAAEHMGSRAVMATDIIDELGRAADTLDEQILYPQN